jgi:hypothetical protein
MVHQRDKLDPDPHQSDMLDPDPHQFVYQYLELKSREIIFICYSIMINRNVKHLN